MTRQVARSHPVKPLTDIDRYIFRQVTMPMLAVFLIAASLLILDKMRKLFDFVATEGGPVSVVFRMLANLLPEYFHATVQTNDIKAYCSPVRSALFS